MSIWYQYIFIHVEMLENDFESESTWPKKSLKLIYYLFVVRVIVICVNGPVEGIQHLFVKLQLSLPSNSAQLLSLI